MDDKELRRLQDPETWDDNKAERKPGVQRPRAVVSVAFSRDDFERVAQYAERNGFKVSEFIRESALAQVRTESQGATLVLSSGGVHPIMYLHGRPTIAAVSEGTILQLDIHEAVTA
jgi:hypothetical protein